MRKQSLYLPGFVCALTLFSGCTAKKKESAPKEAAPVVAQPMVKWKTTKAEVEHLYGKPKHEYRGQENGSDYLVWFYELPKEVNPSPAADLPPSVTAGMLDELVVCFDEHDIVKCFVRSEPFTQTESKKRTAKIRISSDGTPPFTYKLFLNWREIKIDPNLWVKEDNRTVSYLIDEVDKKNTGSYMVIVMNKEGWVPTPTIKLKVSSTHQSAGEETPATP